MLSEILAAYETKRLEAGPLPGGSAPYSASKFFKLRDGTSTRAAKPWDHKFSVEGRARTRSTLKTASRVSNPGSVISLGTARPAPQFYPWQSITIEADNIIDSHGKYKKVTANTQCQKGEAAYDLGLVLNYGYAAGSPQALRFITEHVEMIHRPPYSDWECSLTCGTTSAIDIIIRMLCDRGDSILCESFTYPGTIEAAKALGVKMVGIKMDHEGLLPEDLESILSNWDPSRGPKPSLLYTIPTGQNPSGATQTAERRKAIYAIAEQHDLLILEDDPYYFIQLAPQLCTESNSSTPYADLQTSYLRTLPPSYLSLDTAGRVLRLDATSKILAPGLRLGWVTGSTQLLDKFLNHSDLSTISPSGPSQMMLYKLLDESWGHTGFVNWLAHLSSQHSERLSRLLAACARHLPREICSWTTPTAGMFLWIRIGWREHPLAKAQTRADAQRVDDTNNQLALTVEDGIYAAAIDHGVLVSKGSWFANDRAVLTEVFFRLTFAAAADDALEKAVERFGAALKSEFNVVVDA